MKNRILILSALMCMVGSAGYASEFIDSDCDSITTVSESDYVAPTQMAIQPSALRQAKLLTIKPVSADDRKPLWDGTTKNYVARGFDKTVDWRDGVPVWDDSISDYTKKDFSDWFLEPLPELYLRDADISAENDVAVDLYNQNMADAVATRARIEELLNPARPTENLWTDGILADKSDDCTSGNRKFGAPNPKYTAQDMTEIINTTFVSDDGCPFETETECNIWRRKPIIRETVSPRSPKIRTEKLNDFVDAVQCNINISASDPTAMPLLERYKMLMNSAQACCTDGMVYSLKNAGASDGLIYKFMVDDANFYALGSRCLMMTDDELDKKYPNTATASVIADVRNGCLCRGRQWFDAMLAPFKQVYQIVPAFKDARFDYTYIDGLQRKVTVSVNNDVQNVLNQLAQCP